MATQPSYERPLTPVAPVAHTPPAPERRGIGGLLIRFVLTLAGAAGLVVGGLLEWVGPASRVGTEIPVRFLWSTTDQTTTIFVQTVGFVAIALGLLAIVGLALRSGWLTRMAGALGIVEFVLFAITISRSGGMSFPDSMGFGAWLALAGAIVALAGGFLGTRTAVATSPTSVSAVEGPATVVEE